MYFLDKALTLTLAAALMVHDDTTNEFISKHPSPMDWEAAELTDHHADCDIGLTDASLVVPAATRWFGGYRHVR